MGLIVCILTVIVLAVLAIPGGFAMFNRARMSRQERAQIGLAE